MRRWRTAATKLLGIDVPVILAPMGGGPATPALVAAVSAAGGLGSLAGGYLTPDRLRDEIRAVRGATPRPFAVNLFAPPPEPTAPDAGQVEEAVRRLAPYRLEVGLPARPEPRPNPFDFDDQVSVVIDERVPVFSFTFGLLPGGTLERLHGAGCTVVGTGTTVEEAIALTGAGVDAVCAQGAEAGAHRGTFLGPPERAVVGTMALVPQVCDAVPVPVIAAGGIMDGRGVAAALALGAGAAQLGTAFLRCPEAGTSPAWRRALAGATETSTALTSAVTGRMARGIENRLMRELAGATVPPYPVMHTLTSELRRAAAEQGETELMSLWCGQGVRLGTELPAADLLRRIAEDLADAATTLAQAAADVHDG